MMNNRKSLTFKRAFLIMMAMLLMIPAWGPSQASAADTGTDWRYIGPNSAFRTTSGFASAMDNGVLYAASFATISSSNEELSIQSYDGQKWKSITSKKLLSGIGKIGKMAMKVHNGIVYVAFTNYPSGTFPNEFTLVKCVPDSTDYNCSYYSPGAKADYLNFDMNISDDGTPYFGAVKYPTNEAWAFKFQNDSFSPVNLDLGKNILPNNGLKYATNYISVASGSGKTYAAMVDSKPFGGVGVVVQNEGSTMANSIGIAPNTVKQIALSVYGGQPYLAYYDDGIQSNNEDNKIVLKRYEGSQWISQGEYTLPSGGSIWGAVEGKYLDVFVDSSGAYVTIPGIVMKSTGTALEPLGSNLQGGYNFVSVYRDSVSGLLYSGYLNSSGYIEKYGADTVAPLATQFTPATGTVDVSIDTGLEVTFNEIVLPGSGKINLKRVGDDALLGSISASDVSQVTVSYKKAVIKPSTKLKYGTEYYVEIEPGAFKDLDGNLYAGTNDSPVKEWSFKTVADVTAPSLITLSPSDNATEVALDTKLTLTFNEPIVASDAFIDLYKSNGDLVESIKASNKTRVAVSGNKATITPAAALLNDTSYYVIVPKGAFEDESGNDYAGLLTSADWNFKTLKDMIPPKIVSLSPAHQAVDVPRDTKLTLKFSEPVLPVAGKKVMIHYNYQDQEILDLGGPGVEVNGDTVTVTLAKTLPYNFNVQVNVDAGALVDQAGNPSALIQYMSWTFTTVKDTLPPFVTQYSPANGAADVSITPVLRMDFSELVHAANVDKYYSIYKKDGTLVERIHRQNQFGLIAFKDYADEGFGRAGYVAIEFKLNYPLEYDTDYYFNIDSGFVQDGADIGNRQGNDYAGISDGTTWAFRTGPDRDPPKLVGLTPANGSAGVPVKTLMALEFNEPIKAGVGHVSLYKKGTNELVDTIPVKGNRVVVSDVNAILTPSVSLESLTDYYMKVDAGAFQDLKGNSYAGFADSATWAFTTAPDTTAPELVTLTPANGAKQVAVNTDSLVLTFDEKVTAVAGKTIKLFKSGGGTPIATLPVDEMTVAGRTVTAGLKNKLPSGLDYGTEYIVALDYGAFKDLAGNEHRGMSSAWKFTTEYLLSDVESTVVASPTQVIADGTTTSTITVTLRDDQKRTIAGRTVTLSASGGSSVIAPAQAITDAAGQAIFKVKDREVEKVVYSAKAGTTTIKQTAAVNFVAGPINGAVSTVKAAPASVPADGKTTSVIAVTLKDAYGHGNPGQTVSLTPGAGSSSIDAVQPVTDMSGKAVFLVKNQVAEQVVYTARTGSLILQQQATVNFETPVPGSGDGPKASVLQSRIIASPTVVTANGTDFSTVTVMLRDADGTAVTGKKVNLTADGGSSVIAIVRDISDDEGKAVFTVKNAKAERVTFTAKVVNDNVTVADKASVTFESPRSSDPAAPSVSVVKSSIEASPVVVTADGKSFAVLTVTLRDEGGKPIFGKKVALAKDGGSSTVTTIRETTDTDGEAVFKVTNTKAEPVSYSASLEAGGVTLSQRAKVTFESENSDGPSGTNVSVLRSSVTSNPTVVTANGTSSAEIVVRLRDENGIPVSGKKVGLTQRGSSHIVFGNDVSDSLGVVRFTVTSETAEQVTYTAHLTESGATLSQQAIVTFESAPIKAGGSKTSVLDSTVVASPEVVTANGTDVSTITVTLKDVDGLPVSGKTVSLTANVGSSVIEAEAGIVVTDASGQVKFKVKNAKAEQIVYTAKDETDGVTLAQRATVTFETAASDGAGAPVSVLESMVVASPDTVAADGSSFSTVTVTLRSKDKQPIANKQVTLTTNDGSSVIEVVDGGTSNAAGQVTFRVRNAHAEQVEYTAAIEADGVTLAQRAIVTFESSGSGAGGPIVSVLDSMVIASPEQVTANGFDSSLITVTLKDASGAAVSGKRVTLVADGGSSEIVPDGTDASDANGQVKFRVTNVHGEQLTYTAKLTTDNVTLAQRATVTFETAGADSGSSDVSVVHSKVVASPVTVAANGKSFSIITVTLNNAKGDPVLGKKITLYADGGSSVIEPIGIGESDDAGQATFKVTDAVAERVTYTAQVPSDGVTLAQRASVVFEADLSGAETPRASVLKSTVTAAPDNVKADGIDFSTITVVIKKADGNPLSGKTVSLAADSPRVVLTTLAGVTNERGEATFKVRNYYAEKVSFTAKVAADQVTVAQRAAVTFDYASSGSPDEKVISVTKSTVVANPDVVTADGTTKSTVTVKLVDASGSPIADKTVKLTAGTGSSIIAALGGGKSGSDGTVNFEVTNTKAEQVTYSAQVIGEGVMLAERATVTFESPANGGSGEPGISVQNSRVVANPIVVTANGSSFSTITVTLKDVSGTAAVGKKVKLSADGGSSVIAAVNAVTNGQGQAVFTVKNKTAEQVAYTASIEAEGVTLAQRATVTFESSTGGAIADTVVSVVDSTVKASPEQVRADGAEASTLTVTLLNASGQPITGKKVTLTANVGGSSVIAPADGVISGADGVAKFTVTDSKSEQATYTAHVTEDGVALAQRATVTFESDASGGAGTPTVSIVKSTVTASPTIVAANGRATATIAVTLEDASGNPIAGRSVTLEANAGSRSVISPAGSVISGSDGVATFTVTDVKAEQVTYTAKADDATLVQRAKVTFETSQTSLATSVSQSTVTASPITVAADGTAFSTITVVLIDTSGKPVVGKTVSVTGSSASSLVTAVNAKTDANGIATFQVTGTKAESVAYTAAVAEDKATIAQRATVTFESTGTGNTAIADISVIRSTVTATPEVVDADGVQASTVKVQLLNAIGEPIKGLNVSLTASSGFSVIDAVYGTASVATSNDNGEALFLVKNAQAERVTYTAHVAPNVTIAQTAIVIFETPPGGGSGGTGAPGISVVKSTVTATPAQVTADGVQSSLITVTLKDTDGNAMVGKTVSLTAVSGSSVIVDIQAITDVNGQAIFSVTNTKAEQVTYTAAVVSDNARLVQTATVTFETIASGGGSTGSNVSVLNSNVKATPQTVLANGVSASTVTVTLNDVNGVPVAGQTVTLTADGGNSTITPVNAVTNEQGIAEFKVTSLLAGQVTYRAETSDTVIAQTATVTFQTVPTSGTPTTSVARSTVTATPDRVNADGTATATVTVTLLNAVGQPVAGKEVKLTAANGHSVITSAGEVVSDEQGQVMFKVTNVYAEQVIYSAKDMTDNVSIAQTAKVTFLANAGTGSGKSSVTRSTVTVSPGRITADGETYATVTVTLLNTNGQSVVGKKVTLTANGGRSTIAKVGTDVSDAQGKVLFRVSDAYAEQVTYSAKDTTDNVSIAQKVNVTFLANTVTGEQKTSVARSTVTASPADIIGNGIETSTVTVTLRNANGQPVVGKKVKLIASGGNSIIAPAGEVVSDAQGQAIFTVKNNVEEQVTYSAKDMTDNVNIAQTATVKFKPMEPSRKLKPEDVEPEADKKQVTVKDVPPGGKVIIYDDKGGVIGEGVNPGPNAGPIVINIIEPHVIKEGEVIHVTLTEPGKKEGDPEDKTVRKDKDTSLPVPPPKVLADPDSNEVKILDVLPGATIKIYDKDGNVIGTGTNPGPGTGTIVIKVIAPYVIKEGDVIHLTATEPGLKESSKTSKTVTRDDLVSNKLKPEQIEPESDKKTVTVKDVPPGGKVKIYDKDGKVIGEGTNPGPGPGPVVISAPDLKEGDVIHATLTEPGKRESDKTEKTATKDKDTSLPPKGAFVRQASDEVEVPNVPAGTTVNVYDEEGNLIGTASNPGSVPAKVVVPLKPKKPLLPGDIVQVTQTEPGKKESGKVPATVPSRKLYDVETEVKDKTIKVTVKPKPGTNPDVETAYLIIQGIRGDTPVYVKSYKIDLKNIPAEFPFELDKAIAGDKLHIVIASKPANTRSDVGYSLSDEATVTL
ncbi:Ig-like domain-containing protein [Cohnella herbarum]|uniref:Big-1 domain-containing protein n=1 Tax=Cohnella herbarum TaxID=2728023 RepID=A0A7Z2ZLU8_9BACL|nr:Ig-like domain-containing protein [Cohnella herbarum]QJD84666.1 hypothetical protein HH215_16740 [Cohnella herbarum]